MGAPKVSKSFLMAQLAYHVSMGLPPVGVRRPPGNSPLSGPEDDHHRLQERLYRMFGTDSAGTTYTSPSTPSSWARPGQTAKGLCPGTSGHPLIIVDTLQKSGRRAGTRLAYANDYEVINQAETFADESGVCLLLVHHTRKQQADDKFDMISRHQRPVGCGGRGPFCSKGRRTDSRHAGYLGRDQQDQRLYLTRDEAPCVASWSGQKRNCGENRLTRYWRPWPLW